MADHLTLTELAEVVRRLHAAAPHMRDKIDLLAAAALGRRQVQWVEVTHADGSVEVLEADRYQRLTATDLAHCRLRMLTEAEARSRRGLG